MSAPDPPPTRASHPDPGSDGEPGGGAAHQQKDSVKVAVNIRPLITVELQDGCTDCVAVTPHEPQVQIGPHVFTFDHVYGSSDLPSSLIFEQCVHPLIDALFSGYNAAVLAYGQIFKEEVFDLLDSKHAAVRLDSVSSTWDPEQGMSLAEWWWHLRQQLPGAKRKGFDTLFALITWHLWNEQNARVFRDVAAGVNLVIHMIRQEGLCWIGAGALNLGCLFVA
ncbi:hypothetical protein C2845_PM05G27800 [Panicum miliaceum]|uniref:Kinesin motor domain-containing protein n=1 Tax=Panicum miliaceum TaxID=4540 RepID=A0A3L6SY40_PANMI|nr:hypothetical protein C2845_PM05G27800 [Panicum miliaceum]